MSQFTKKAIIDSFIELSQTVPIDKITVTMISRQCGINRNTFYYYFSDIPALLDYVTEKHLDLILLRNGKVGFMNGCMVDLVEFMEKNDKAMSGIFNSMTKDELLAFADHAATYLVESYLKMNYDDLAIKQDDRDMLVRIFSSGVSGIFMKWYNDHKDFDISKDIEKVGKIFSKCILQIMKEFSENE